jgi:hypothetical protein
VSSKVKRGDFIKEAGSYGLVLTAGPKTFDVIWTGGSTSRYRHGARIFDLANEDRHLSALERESLTRDAIDARNERKQGAGIKRGQIWPSR